MFISMFGSLSCTINAIHSVYYAHKIDTFMFYNPCIECHSRTVIFSFSAIRTLKTFTRSTMNASRLAHLALLHFHEDRTDKMDLIDLCQTFLRIGLIGLVGLKNAETVSLANRRHCLNTRRCAELYRYVHCPVCSALL